MSNHWHFFLTNLSFFAAPYKPANITTASVDAISISISWLPPSVGNYDGIQVTLAPLSSANTTSPTVDVDRSEGDSVVVGDLTAGTEYSVLVQAYAGNETVTNRKFSNSLENIDRTCKCQVIFSIENIIFAMTALFLIHT